MKKKIIIAAIIVVVIAAVVTGVLLYLDHQRVLKEQAEQAKQIELAQQAELERIANTPIVSGIDTLSEKFSPFFAQSGL